MAGILIKGRVWTQREGHVQTKAERRVMHEQAKECQRGPATHQKQGREGWNRFRRNQPCWGHLDFGLQASRAVKQYVPAVWASQCAVLCLGGPENPYCHSPCVICCYSCHSLSPGAPPPGSPGMIHHGQQLRTRGLAKWCDLSDSPQLPSTGTGSHSQVGGFWDHAPNPLAVLPLLILDVASFTPQRGASPRSN